MKSKKRRRDEDKGSGKDGAGDPDHDRKKIVRIRAKVHCTAAGLPGLDAPSNVASKKSVLERGRGVGSAATLPEWHPLSKVF